MNLTRTLDAESEALSLTDVRNQLRVTVSDDDDSFRLFIAGIRHQTEWYLGKTLITSTWQYKLDSFEELICLPMGPVQSVSSVEYVDTAGVSQTLNASLYQSDRSGRLAAAYNKTWPSTRQQFDAVTVTYIAGETHAGNVKQDIKLAMLLWIGACDLNRENVAFTQVSEIPNSAKDILAPHRNWKL